MITRGHPRQATPTWFAGAVAAVLLLAALPAAGAEPPAPAPEWAPAPPADRPLSLSRALATALEHDPAVHVARERRRLQAGTLRAATGTFDYQLALEASFERESSLLGAGRRSSESGRRRLLASVAETFQRIADEIQRQLDSGVFGPLPDCVETELRFGNTVTVIHCPPPSATIDLEALLEGTGDAGFDEVSERLIQAWRAQLEQFLAVSRFVAWASREILRMQGVIPTIEDRDTLSLSLGLAHLFRNGIYLEPQIEVEAVRDTYRGKPLNPGFGGRGQLVRYDSRIGFGLDIPLGKGRGRVSTGAPERAARANLEAALEAEAFTLSQTALAVTVAYWNAAAAARRVEILEASVTREHHLLELGRALAAAEELAPADLEQLRARVAATEASLRGARRALTLARAELARAMGIEPTTPEHLPLPADRLPDPPGRDQLARWHDAVRGSSLLDLRADWRSADRAVEAALILAEAARADLKRQVNLTLDLWYSGLYEDSRTMSPDHILSPFGNAFSTGFTGPSARIALVFDWPFANSAAEGRLEQSLALRRRAEISRRDVERRARSRAQQRLGELERALEEIDRQRASLEAYRRSLEATRELFRHGERTAVDLVVTEEEIVAAELALVDAHLRAATLEAQLRFELGELVRYHIRDGEVVVEAVVPATAARS